MTSVGSQAAKVRASVKIWRIASSEMAGMGADSL